LTRLGIEIPQPTIAPEISSSADFGKGFASAAPIEAGIRLVTFN
jgi:hypothetical protein